MQIKDFLQRFGKLSYKETDDFLREINRALSNKKASNVIARQLGAEYSKPPKIAVIGVAGVGKSSTINALFNPTPLLEVGDAVAATTEPTEIIIDLQERGELIIVDMPGVGQSMNTEGKYILMYKDLLSQCDVALWVLKADSRDYKQIQEYILSIIPEEIRKRLVIGINQIDKMEPGNWVNELNVPSDAQDKNIEAKVNDMKKVFSEVGINPAFVVPYSAKKRYRLAGLFTAILKACPERAWVLDGRKKISSYLDNTEGAFTQTGSLASEFWETITVVKHILLDVGEKLANIEGRLISIEQPKAKTNTLKTSKATRKNRRNQKKTKQIPSIKKELNSLSAQALIPSISMLDKVAIPPAKSSELSVASASNASVLSKNTTLINRLKSENNFTESNLKTNPSNKSNQPLQEQKITKQEKPSESPQDIQPEKSLSADERKKYEFKRAQEIITNQKEEVKQELETKSSFFRGFKNIVQGVPGLIKKAKKVIEMVVDKVLEKIVKVIVDKAFGG